MYVLTVKIIFSNRWNQMKEIIFYILDGYLINLLIVTSAGLRRLVRRSLHRVWHRGRRRARSLRRQNQEVHRSHKDQHELHRSGVYRFLSGEKTRQGGF